MRRFILTLLTVAVALTIPAADATAHPLGNFSVNHLTRIGISADRVDLHYILDQAEIPTFQERGTPLSVLLARKQAQIRRGLSLTVNGHAVGLRILPGARISFPPGQGGLRLTRVELNLTATVQASGRVTLHDDTYSGRVGWKAIVAQRAAGTAVHSSAPSADPTDGLRHYPQDLLSSPFDQRDATFTVRSGSGSLSAPAAPGGHAQTTTNRSGDGFAAVFADAASGKGVLVLLILAALAWGAIHALSPGHGKTMVAAYLVGTRGTPRQALLLGLTVTITHTIGVFALGLVTLALSQYILPEQLYPWLTLVSGLLVVIIGLGVMRTRIRSWHTSRDNRQDGRSQPAHQHRANHHHGENHTGENHIHDHDHGHHHGGHHHRHDPPERLTRRALIAMGASAGLIPCPSALVVLLGALAQHQVALGLLLILSFSAGLALTLSALGLLVVYAGRLSTRLNLSGRLIAVLPAISSLIIVAVGCALTAQALPAVL